MLFPRADVSIRINYLRLLRVMGAAPPWGQSLLRSCLAAHSFPPPPPRDVLSAFGTSVTPIRVTPNTSGVGSVNDHIDTWEDESVRNL